MTAARVEDVHPGREPVTPELFRSVFRDHAARVTVVTGSDGVRPAGLTATSLASVSADPPLVSFAVSRTASAWATLEHSDRLTVHLLDVEQDWLAQRFATSGVDRFAPPVRWRWSASGEPVLDDCAATLGCRVARHVPAGDHVLVIAEVETAGLRRSGQPLLYHDGGFTQLA